MAQFKRTLFATSYFGRAFTFTGEYITRITDAGEKFSGKVDVQIKANLPIMTYNMVSDSWVIPTSWTVTPSNGYASIAKVNESATFFACADKFKLVFSQNADYGVVKVDVFGDDNKNPETFTVDTAVSSTLSFNRPYENTWVKVTTQDAKRVIIRRMEARVASFKANVKTAPTYTSQDTNSLTLTHPVTFPNGLEPNGQGFIVGESAAVTNQQAVAIELILATSDTNPASSPVIDSITLSSGDLNEYANTGWWECAINMNNVASQDGVSFKRTKRVSFETNNIPEEIINNPNWWDTYLSIRSTSRNLGSTITTIPTDANVRLPSYWEPMTATYRYYNNEIVSRLSLGQAGNGTFTESKKYGLAFYGPIDSNQLSFNYSQVVRWEKFKQTSAFPLQHNGTSIVLQLWDTPEIEKYYPVFEQTITAQNNPYETVLALSKAYPVLYIGIVLKSTDATQSPVIDDLDLFIDLLFSRTIQYNTNLVSGFDNVAPNRPLPQAEEGTKLLATTNTSVFSIPTVATKRRYQLTFSPMYNNQNLVYFGDAKGKPLTNTSYLEEVSTMRLYSLVKPDEPSASTQDPSGTRLLWHYRYDGGTVIYPNVAEREVGTDFTPNLVKDKTYRLKIINGWPQQQISLAQNINWEDLALMINLDKDDLIEANPNAILYGGELLAGTSIYLPNDTVNNMINLKFKSNNSLFSNQSIWNKSNANDYVLASVSGNNEVVMDWVSEERFFAGVLNTANLDKSYLRTQNLSNEQSLPDRLTTNQTNEPILYSTLAVQHQVALEDILLANNQLMYYGEDVAVQPGESYVIPGSPALPTIPPEVWFEEENPYVVEIIPNTVRKTFDNILLPTSVIKAGSDDEPAIQYTTKESSPRTHTLTRGSFAHGRDALPYANIRSVTRITNNRTSESYIAYSKVGTTEMGDYIIKGNIIDWSPTHATSKEPAAGDTYTVTFTTDIVQTLKILYTSDYKEKLAYDKLWRSREVKELEAVVTPTEDVYLDVPTIDSYSDVTGYLTNIKYVVEDNDLWVKSAVVETQDGPKVHLTLNGKDPKRNWHPTVNTGYYYLNEQEYYLYSEPITHHYAEEDIPIIEEVTYIPQGLTIT